MFSALKNLGGIALGCLVLLGAIMIPLILIYGTVFVAGKLLPMLTLAATVAFALCLNFLLPLSLFRFTRVIAACGLLIASFVFGAVLWLTGVVVTYDYWGIGGLFIGLVIAGVGVVPIAMLALALHAEWYDLAASIFMIVLTFGARALALYLGHRIDVDTMPRNHSLAWAGKIYVGFMWLFIAFGYGATLFYRGWEFFIPGQGHFNVVGSFVLTMVLMLPGFGIIKLGERLERRKRHSASVAVA